MAPGSIGKIAGHYRSRPPEEGERGTAHPPVAEWDELREAALVLSREDRQRIGPLGVGDHLGVGFEGHRVSL